MSKLPIDWPTTPCTFCEGTGIMREEKSYLSRLVEEDEFTEYTAIVGERCPLCRGRGETFGTTPTLNS
ncbi:MAG: hypothetical protein JNN24_03365 [Hyphomicrobium zavarzinii]|uniref:hypothetical protein n=1 Tax=Hyphomicrobium zavarzinii TaxID=48292 RepID=UPI001A410CE7|nr:hypothetical protein [Hyphomicrobium zavarzinii]MBL8844789.1 hypothetical protein [Hyphomicrobium zavarzinii]